MPESRRQRKDKLEVRTRNLDERIQELTGELDSCSSEERVTEILAERGKAYEEVAVLDATIRALEREIEQQDAQQDETAARLWREQDLPKARAELEGLVNVCAERMQAFMSSWWDLHDAEQQWKQKHSDRGAPQPRGFKSYAGRDVFQFLHVGAPPLRLRRSDPVLKHMGKSLYEHGKPTMKRPEVSPIEPEGA